MTTDSRTPEHRGKHVTLHFPAEKLPPELRNGLDPHQHVRVTIEEEGQEPSSLVSMIGSGQGCYPTPKDAVETIRELRNEWE